MALWPAPRGRMDDWTASATAPAAANGTAPKPTKPVTLTQARSFMDDIGATPAQAMFVPRACSRDRVRVANHEPRVWIKHRQKRSGCYCAS